MDSGESSTNLRESSANSHESIKSIVRESNPNKQREIVAMFDSIAQNYDIANRILSFGIDKKWRKEACEKAIGLCEKDSLDILDIACGTGDMIAQWLKTIGNSSLTQSLRELEKSAFDRRLALSQADFPAQPTKQGEAEVSLSNLTQDTRIANDSKDLNNPSLRDSQRESKQSKDSPSLAEGARGWVNLPKLTSIRGIDPSTEMLKIAAQKLPPSVILQNGEAKDLRVDNDSVDILSIAYGLRNVVEVDSALKEFHRVLRKEGILVILEFSKKDNENIFDKIARFYTKRILPYIGGFISKNYAAYKYLPNSVDGFLSLEQIAHKLQNLGFSIKTSKRYFCNVCSLIIAQKD